MRTWDEPPEVRGTGRTTDQMLLMERGSLFITLPHATSYARDLQRHLGREGFFEIAGPDVLKDGWHRQFVGRRYSQIEVDHAACLDELEAEKLARARAVCCR
jgi:hypothetical protein